MSSEGKTHPAAEIAARFARRVDGSLAGNRFRSLVYSAAAAVYVPAVIGIFSERTALIHGGKAFTLADYVSLGFTAAFLVLLAAFLFSFVSPESFDDDADERPFKEKFLSVLRIVINAITKTAGHLKRYSSIERYMVFAVLAICAAMISMMTEQAMHWIRIFWWILFRTNPENATIIQKWMYWTSGVAVAGSLICFWKVRQAGGAERPILWASTARAGTPKPIVTENLPLIIRPQDSRLITVDGALKDIMIALADWDPGIQYSERDYELDLRAHLAISFPTRLVQNQVRIDSGRPDLIIDNSLLIEIKSNFSKGAADRAKGQVIGYLDSWRHRGPVFLLLCGPVSDNVPAMFESWANEQRQLGKPLSLIIAGTH